MKGLTTPCFTQSLLLFTEALPWQKAVISGISYEWTDSLSAILQLPVLRNKLSQKKNSCACSPSSKLPPGLSQHNESWWWQLHLEEKQHRWQQRRRGEKNRGEKNSRGENRPQTKKGMKDPSLLLSPSSSEPEGHDDGWVPQQPKAWAS